VATTASTPTAAGSCAKSGHADSATMSVCAAGKLARSAAMAGLSSAVSTMSSVSGAPCRRPYAATMCSPSRTQRPALRRARDEAMSCAASFSRGLSRDVMRGMGAPKL
jgi:hypothetical protein